MERRKIRLADYDAVLAEVEALRASGYDRAGNWGLGSGCHHLAAVMTMSLDGFPRVLPWPARVLFRWFFLPRMLRHGVFRGRFPAPSWIQPPPALEDETGVERLRAVIERLKQHTGAMKPSPLFGMLTPEQWREVHLWHCEHHLSYLLPRKAPSPCPVP
jgi:hypothetical protein